MIILQHALVITAAFAVFCYVCRLSQMSWQTTKVSPLLMHISLTIATCWSGYKGWLEVGDLGNACTVLGALMWISISYGTWKRGVPSHFAKTMDWPEIHR